MLTWREETLQRCHVTIWQESAPWNHPKVKGKERTDRHYETRWLEGPRQHSTSHPHMLTSGEKNIRIKKRNSALSHKEKKTSCNLQNCESIAQSDSNSIQRLQIWITTDTLMQRKEATKTHSMCRLYQREPPVQDKLIIQCFAKQRALLITWCLSKMLRFVTYLNRKIKGKYC